MVFITIKPTITIESMIATEGSYEIANHSVSPIIKITKENSTELQYKVAVIFDDFQSVTAPNGHEVYAPCWNININDIPVSETRNQEMSFCSSKEFVFKPLNKDTLEIKEIDVFGTTFYHVNMKTMISKKVSEEETAFDKTAIIEKAKTFLPNPSNSAEKVCSIFHSFSGILFYTKDINDENPHKGQLFHANNQDDDIKECKIEGRGFERCPGGGAIWTFYFPAKETNPLNTIRFQPYSKKKDDDYKDFETTLNGKNIEVINCEK